ncbi:MAG: hypothetical protein ACXW2P_11520 [Thermoanaerobaculia bacterium]
MIARRRIRFVALFTALFARETGWTEPATARSSESRFSMNDISCHIPARCRRTSAAETAFSSISFSRM